jgi:hypothetical protein
MERKTPLKHAQLSPVLDGMQQWLTGLSGDVGNAYGAKVMKHADKVVNAVCDLRFALETERCRERGPGDSTHPC